MRTHTVQPHTRRVTSCCFLVRRIASPLFFTSPNGTALNSISTMTYLPSTCIVAEPVIPSTEIPLSPLSDNWMCQTSCVRTLTKYTVERYPKKYIVKSMRIHTNTSTIYQRRWKSLSLRQLVQPLFSWFSRLPMPPSAWQAWRSLRHKTGCTSRQWLWVRHPSWTWTEPYSFERSTWQTWRHNETSCLLWKEEGQMCETMQSSHLLSDVPGPFRVMLKTHGSSKNPVFNLFFTDPRGLGSQGGVGWELRRVGTSACTTADFASTFSSHGGKHWRIGKASFFYPFFWVGGGSQDEEVKVESGGNFWVGTSKIILDLYHVICLVRWIMGRIGEVGREVVKKLDYQW